MENLRKSDATFPKKLARAYAKTNISYTLIRTFHFLLCRASAYYYSCTKCSEKFRNMRRHFCKAVSEISFL